MSVAFPLTLGVALVIGTIWDFTSATQAPGVLLWGGVALLLAAVVCAALAYSWRLQEQRDKAQAAALRPDPRAKTKRVKEPGAVLAIVLAVVGGIALSIYPRTLAQATSDENGLAPYSAMLLLSISALVSSPFLVLFFTTFPIAGVAGGPGGYLSLSKKQHLLGVIGGILWVAGMLSSLLIAVAPRATQANPLALYALTQGAPVVAAAWGLLVWKEFGNASYRARLLMSGMLVLFLAGLGLVAFALFQAK
jgi:glucose uptake protein